MAQILKEDVRNKIYRAAVEEFYRKDYQSAALRSIAGNAGVPVGLIYTYYKGKEALFDAVVSSVYYDFRDFLLRDKVSEADPGYKDFFQTEMPFCLQLLKNRRRPFLILIDKSKGTMYENAREEFIRLTQNHIQRIEENSIEMRCGVKVDDLFYHILADNFMEGLFEIARHYKNEEWAVQMLHLLSRHHFYGMNALDK